MKTSVKLTDEQRELLQSLEQTLEGEAGKRHSPQNRTWLDGVKDFFERIAS